MPRSAARDEGEARLMAFLEERREAEEQGEAKRFSRVSTAALVRERIFFDRLTEAMKDQFSGRRRKVVGIRKKRSTPPGRALNLVISDIHFGADLDPLEVGRKYSQVEECRRLAAVCRQAAEYKRHYRDETELNLHLLGDLIQGQLHDPRDGRPLAAQMASVTGALVQATEYLADAFPRGVTVRCTPGNHGRNTARHRERAVFQKWDAIETMIYVALREAVRRTKHVEVQIGLQPFYTWRSFDKLGWATHGDTVLKPGNPGRSINVEDIRTQTNHINTVAAKRLGEEYSLFVCGHVHIGNLTHLPEGAAFMSNGCLIPPDAYANSIGIMDCFCGQSLFESVPGHIVGDYRLIGVDEADDADESLDSIILPRGL